MIGELEPQTAVVDVLRGRVVVSWPGELDDCELCADCMRCERPDHRIRPVHMVCACSAGEGAGA
jgi:hypothetical protein